MVLQWIATGVLDHLAEMTGLHPSAEEIVAIFHSLDMLIL
jgi:hypothetical protein